MRKLLVLLLMLLLSACSERPLPQQNTEGGAIEIEIVSAPAIVNPGGVYFVAAQVTGGEGVDSIEVAILNPNDGTLLWTFYLHDDGGALHPNDGDQVAFDGLFSQNILWAVETENLTSTLWRFGAANAVGSAAQSVDKTVETRENSAPVLLDVVTPDSLPSGFKGQLEFRATVLDSNGYDDIALVSYQAFQNNLLNFEIQLDSTNEPGLYRHVVDKSFAVGKKGEYRLKFKAVDQSGAESNIVERTVVIANQPPALLGFVHPDSVMLPESGNIVAFLITVRVDDDQGLLDIKDVKMEWKKPDGSYSQNSPFDLYDNGLPWNENFEGWDDGWRGDEKEGDGIYSITGIFDPNQPLGDYQLTFYADDFAGNQSERITRIITLYPREGN